MIESNHDQTTSGAATDPGQPQNPVVPSDKTIESDEKRTLSDLDRVFGDINTTGMTTLLKLYVTPFTDVMPQSVDLIPYNTETVRSEMELTNLRHSPWLWMDPLRVYGAEYPYPAGAGPPAYEAGNINVNIPDMAYFEVQVARTRRAEMEMPIYSNIAVTLQAFANPELSAAQMSQHHALHPVQFQRDPQAMTTILTMCPKSSDSYYDEAPLLRLALLELTMVTAEHLQRTSTVVQTTFDNCVPGEAPVVGWNVLPANNTAGCKQPNNLDGTCNMFAVTLDIFAQLAAGTWKNRNAAWLNVNLNTVVVVPVQAGWAGAEWLIPYILSFTTTTWWNFARTASWNNIRTRIDEDQIDHAGVRSLVQACTVVVSGRFSHIMVVIVDRNSDTYGPNGQFWIRKIGNQSIPVFTGQLAGVNDNHFATRAYTWLGRVGVQPGNISSLNRAWRELCSMVSLPGMARRVLTMAAELSYTRSLPFKVVTGNVAEGQRRYDGPWALTDEGISIDGTNMSRWDLACHVNAPAIQLTRAKSTLRHSSAGLYPASVCYIGTGEAHALGIPCFNSIQYHAPQYAVNQSSYLARVAIAAGLFVTTCSQETFNIVDAQIYCQGLSSLMLGVSGWLYGCTGMNAMVNSGISEFEIFAPVWASVILTEATDKFVIPASRYGRRGAGLEQAASGTWNFSVLIQTLYNRAAAESTDDFGNVNVPWWYVRAVQDKMGLTYSTKTVPRAMQVGAALGGGRRLVYTFSPSSSWPDQYMVQADLSYESNHWNFAATAEANGALVNMELFWYPDRYYDMTRESTALGDFDVLYPVQASGVISITMSGGDYTSQYITTDPSNANWMKSMVWGSTPVDLQFPQTYPTVIGGLRYPDLFWDWLWEGPKKVGPHVLMGNWGAAASEGFKHLAEPVAVWGADKIKSWVDARTT